jgi:hypothetical protein
MNTPTVHNEAPAVPIEAPSRNGAPPTQRRAFSAAELAYIVGIPAAWGILLLFHPLGGDRFYEVVEGDVVPWVTVHLGMGIFVPLFAGVVYLLLRGVEGTAATVSRIGLAVFAILYAAWELVLGVGTGILTEQVSGLPETQQAVGADLVDSYSESAVIQVLSVVGSIGLAMAMIGAAIALRRAYGLGWVPLALMLLSIPLIAIHEPPFGPVGLVIFIAAALLVVRERGSRPEPSARHLDQPVPTGPA